jgi:hypothetical protein
MSLNKYNLSLVMGFLHEEEVGWQAVLPSSTAMKDFVAPTSTPSPLLLPPSVISELHNSLFFWVFGVSLSWDFALGFDVFLVVFSLLFLFSSYTFMLHSLR